MGRRLVAILFFMGRGLVGILFIMGRRLVSILFSWDVGWWEFCFLGTWVGGNFVFLGRSLVGILFFMGWRLAGFAQSFSEVTSRLSPLI